MKIPLFILIFFLLGAFFIISENQLALQNEKAREDFGELYGGWLAKVIDNGREVTAYVVKLDWLPEE